MENFTVAPYKRIPIPASGKCLLVESGRIQETFSCGIRNPGLWNPECSSRNPESKFLWQVIRNPGQEFATHFVESRTQDCLGFSYIR